MSRGAVDKPFLWITLLLTGLGFLTFLSAALGLLADKESAGFGNVALNQFFFGLVGGLVALFITSRISYKFWKKYAFWIFLFSVVLTAAVFLPGIGLTHAGATRWLSIGPFTLQPSEILKFGTIIYFSAWASGVRTKISTIKFGLVPVGIMLALTAILLLKQPDTGTFLVLTSAIIAMFIVSGARWKHFFALLLVLALALTTLIYFKPYLQDRITTFLNPQEDALGAGYQVRQSLIAIGSGDIFGRGFGQSIQKFSFLPEPIGDSIFAVAAEEFGFVGASGIILLFVFFAYRGFVLAQRAPDVFSRLVVVGLVILIISQSFMNIASMLGIFPLTGIPLLFISHGGTALLVALAEVGVILNISRKI